MNKMSRVDSKAGIFTKENSAQSLKHFISKSVFTLLITIATLGTMSFTQDDTITNDIDTNLTAKKETAKDTKEKNCCETVAVKPVEYAKTVQLSIPSTKAAIIVDKATIQSFMRESSGVKISFTAFTSFSIVSDEDMRHNFVLSTLHPLANNSNLADEDMINSFTEEVVLSSMKSITNNTIIADENMISAFMKEHFTINIAAYNNVDALISDSEMTDAFEEENRISY